MFQRLSMAICLHLIGRPSERRQKNTSYSYTESYLLPRKILENLAGKLNALILLPSRSGFSVLNPYLYSFLCDFIIIELKC